MVWDELDRKEKAKTGTLVRYSRDSVRVCVMVLYFYMIWLAYECCVHSMNRAVVDI